jgi:hypothetical protein
MLVVLQATSTYAPSQRFQLRANQVAKVGRSEWADFSFGGDAIMADVQFEIRSTADICTILSLSSQPPTLLNGKEVKSAEIHHGDRIEAGETRFSVHIEGQRPATLMRTAAPTDDCAYLEFGEDVNKMAASAKSPDALIDELAAQGKVQDALRLRAHLLPKRQAVWWACLCVRHELDAPLPAPQVAALEAAEDWVREPDDEHRRLAEKRAEAAKFSGIGATLALSAFWSDGSIAPEGNSDVMADERLTSQGVAATLISAAYHGDPTKSDDRIKSFLAKGKEMAHGKIPLPKADN